MLFKYPLQLRFRLLAFAPQMLVSDSSGAEVLYCEQKVFALRETVRIFSNQTTKQQIFGIKSQQIIDFGAQYFFYRGVDETTPIGSIKEEGLKSLLKATYNLYDASNTVVYTLKETNPWIKLADFAFSQLPFLGILGGYFFNPIYEIIDTRRSQVVMRLKKQPSFWERQFSIEVLDSALKENDETICILGVMMMIQLQRSRG